MGEKSLPASTNYTTRFTPEKKGNSPAGRMPVIGQSGEIPFSLLGG
jgi:hypothetical protein